MIGDIDLLFGALELQLCRVQADCVPGACCWANAPRQRLNGGTEFFHRSGFGQVDVGTAAVAAHSVVDLCPPGDHDDADAGFGSAYAPGQAEPKAGLPWCGPSVFFKVPITVTSTSFCPRLIHLVTSHSQGGASMKPAGLPLTATLATLPHQLGSETTNRPVRFSTSKRSR